MDHINLTSTEPFIPAELPRPARLTSYREAISTINYYVGRYADRINEIASTQGHESRQRLLFAIVRLIFFWKETLLFLLRGTLTAPQKASLLFLQNVFASVLMTTAMFIMSTIFRVLFTTTVR